ncbi:MAG TPA: CsgG/HfaB family protein, partial [bacterium]|nr:CsgG/HfaB family protein [bacterium]
DYFVLGAVTDFYASQQTTASDALGRQRQKSALTMTVDARIVNTKTGEILAANTVQIDEPKIVGSPNDALESRIEKMRQDMVRKAAKQLAFNVVNAVYPISIAKVSGDKIYLNRGASLGMGVGDTLTVYTQGEAIMDPDTKRPLGYEETIVGDIVVDEVQERLAIASTISGTVKEGMLCRPVASSSESGVSEEADQEKGRGTLAILGFTKLDGISAEVVEVVQTYFYTELGNRGQYPDLQVVERQQLEKLKLEMDLSEEGYLSPATAMRIGELTGAQYCLVGSIHQYAEESKESVLREDLRKTITEISFSMDCRVLETEKGEVIDTAIASERVKAQSNVDEARSAVLRSAVRKACADLFGGVVSDNSAPVAEAGASDQTVSNDMNPEQGVPGAFLVVSAFA